MTKTAEQIAAKIGLKQIHQTMTAMRAVQTLAPTFRSGKQPEPEVVAAIAGLDALLHRQLEAAGLEYVAAWKQFDAK